MEFGPKDIRQHGKGSLNTLGASDAVWFVCLSVSVTSQCSTETGLTENHTRRRKMPQNAYCYETHLRYIAFTNNNKNSSGDEIAKYRYMNRPKFSMLNAK